MNNKRDALEAALLRALDEACAREMTWGIDDCALWCAGVLRQALGYDPAQHWRSAQYRDAMGAASALGPLGLGYALRSVARDHQWSRVDPADARVGDIGVALLPSVAEGNIVHRTTTMICRAPGWFVARNETGFTALSHQVVRIAWSVV